MGQTLLTVAFNHPQLWKDASMLSPMQRRLYCDQYGHSGLLIQQTYILVVHIALSIDDEWHTVNDCYGRDHR